MGNFKEIKTEWDLTLLLNGDSDPSIEEKRKEIEKRVKNFVEKWKNRDDYLMKPEILKEALDEYVKLELNGPTEGDGAGTIDSYYFWLRMQIDMNDPALKAAYTKSIDFATKLNNEIKFFRLNISKISLQDQKNFLDNFTLKEYRHYLEKTFSESKYLLSEEEEKIISLKQITSYSKWIEMLSGFLAKEERDILILVGTGKMKNFSEIISLISDKDKKVRDSAAIALNDILATRIEIAEAEINSIFYNKKVDDELRKLHRPDMLRHISDDLDTEIVDSLLESVSNRFDISKKYYELKARLLNVKKMEYHERNVEYGEIDKKYFYKEALDLIFRVFSNLDNGFANILKRFVEEGRIDAFPKKGKRQGAFCTDSLLSQPTYIMLNHTEKLNDVLTIAHELGHGINSELMKEKQNFLNCGMVLSTAEVASTFMEDFVLDELMKEADEEIRLALMMMRLNDCITTIFRQVACYKFEYELHSAFREKGYLSKEEIGKIFQKHMASYMGDAVEQSKGSENWWVHWHHIRNYFYVYSYASGLLISKALQANVKRDKSYIEKVKDFLSAGTSDSPKNIFLKLGIDITKKNFWEKGINEIDSLLNETESLAKKLGKI